MTGKRNSRNRNKKGGNSGGNENSRKTSNDGRSKNMIGGNRGRNENSGTTSYNDRNRNKKGGNSGGNENSRKTSNDGRSKNMIGGNRGRNENSGTTSYNDSFSGAQSQPQMKVTDLKYSSWKTSSEENAEEDEGNTIQNNTPEISQRKPCQLELAKHDWPLFEKSLRLYHWYNTFRKKTVDKEISSQSSTSDDSEDDCSERQSLCSGKSKPSMSKCSQKKRKNYHSSKNKNADPPNKYRSLSIFPSKEDITNEFPFIRSNIVKGEYKNCEHYLDIQFRLFREDYIRPLRDSIEELKQKIEECKERTFGKYEISNVRRLKLSFLYEDAKITNPEHHNTFGLVHTLKFKPLPPSFIWKNSSRLQEGKLLCLSSDEFVDSFIFATVVNREEDGVEKGNIKVCFEDWKHDLLYDFDGSTSYLILEPASAYFESYRHTLSVLKEFNESNLPLQKYIVKAEKTVDRPCYLENETLYDFSPVLEEANYPDNEIPSDLKEVPILDEEKWPSQKELGLDFTQYGVLKAALTKEFCIIQGPPGTGKTFMGLKIVKMLLHNSKIWYPENIEHKCPILIACYTNHALDQFLERIVSECTEDVVRIGDQGESESLEDYRLKNLRNCTEQLISNLSAQKRRLEGKQEYIKDQINTYNFVMEAAARLIFKPEILKKYIGEDHYKSLLSEPCDDMELLLEKWLEVSDGSIETTTGQDMKHVTHKMDNNDTNMNIKEICSWIQWEEHREIKSQMSYKWNKCNDNKQKELTYKICEMDMMHADEIANIQNIWSLSISDRWCLYRYWVAKFIAAVVARVKHLQQEFTDLTRQIKEIRWWKDLAIIQKADVIGVTCTGAAKFHHLVEAIAPRIVIVEEAAEVLEAHLITSVPKSTKHLILIGDHEQLRPLPSVNDLAVQCKLDVSLFERMVKNEVDYWTLVSQHRMRPQIAELLVGTIYDDLSSHDNVYNYENILGVEKNLYFFSHISTESKMDTTYYNLFEAKMVARLARYFLLQGYEPSQITVLATYSGQVKTIKDESIKLLEEKKKTDIKVTTVDNYQGEENDIIIVSFVRSNYERKIGFLKHSNRVCVALSRARKGLYCFGNFEFLASESELWEKIVDKLNQQDATGACLTLICQNHFFRTDIECSGDFKKVSDGGCAKVCGMAMECGHSCKRLCHPTDLEHKKYKCEEKCTKQCENGHPCEKKCHEDCGECTKLRFARLPQCGHRVPVPCFAADLSTYRCEENCEKMLPCRHACQKLCCEPCEPCPRKVPKTLPCTHTVITACYDNDVICTEPCHKTLPCGHQCPNKCSEPCEQNCKRVLAVHLACGHILSVPCEKHTDDIKCNASCGAILPCGHKCPGDCAKCHQGTKHIDCWLNCGKILDGRVTCKLRCGHKNKCSGTFQGKNITIPTERHDLRCSAEHPFRDRHMVNKWKTGYNEDE